MVVPLYSVGTAVQLHEGDDYSAVYIDGTLQQVGKTDNVIEWLLEYFGVSTVQDDAFMQGQLQRSGAAATLDQVKAYRDERQARITEAAAMREQAHGLMGQARRIEQGVQ